MTGAPVSEKIFFSACYRPTQDADRSNFYGLFAALAAGRFRFTLSLIQCTRGRIQRSNGSLFEDFNFTVAQNSVYIGKISKIFPQNCRPTSNQNDF